MPQRILLFSALLLALAAGALSHTTPARAAGPEIGVSDDRVLLAGGTKAQKMVEEWKANGVDTVRIYLLWTRVVPGANSKKMPTGFAPTNSAAYNWFGYDLAVDLVRSAGMKVSLTVSGPGPWWASTNPSKKSGAYSPNPTAFAAFARAAATHFASRVDRYVLGTSPTAARSCSRRSAPPPPTSTATSSAPRTRRSSRPTRARRCRSARSRRRAPHART